MTHFVGGPVQQNTLQFIHKNEGLIEGGIEVMEGLYWGGDFEQMLTIVESDLIAKGDIKFFVGYSGWASGQLKGELELNSWIIFRDVSIDKIFDTNAESLWKEVLNTMGGKYKIISNFPVDPRLN
jgi:putative transcriptional regulator